MNLEEIDHIRNVYMRIEGSPTHPNSGVFECGTDERISGVTRAAITIGPSGVPLVEIRRILNDDAPLERLQIMAVEITGPCETEVLNIRARDL